MVLASSEVLRVKRSSLVPNRLTPTQFTYPYYDPRGTLGGTSFSVLGATIYLKAETQAH